MSRLTMHERSDKVKWIIAFTCIILLIVAVGVIAFSVYCKPVDKQSNDNVVVAEPQANIKGAIMPMSSSVSGNTGNYTFDIIYSGGIYPGLKFTWSGDVGTSLNLTYRICRLSNNFLVFSDTLYKGTMSGSTYSVILSLKKLYTSKKLFHNTDYYIIVYYEGSKISRVGEFNVVLENTSLLPEPPIKTGYTFTGWYTNEECTIPYLEETVTSDITLYAGWRANQYTIHFDANGGIETMGDLVVTYDEDYKLPANNFVKQGYKFIGWSSTPEGEVEIPDGWSVTNLTSQDGVTYTLYAVWERIDLTITFIVDGQQFSQIKVPYGISLADIINSNVNGIFFFVPSTEHLPYDVVEDMSIELQKTKLGEIITHPWALYIGIGIGVVVLLGVVILIVSKVKK